MKRFFLTFLWGALLSSAAGAELRLLPWSENVCRAARFEANSSGRMRITDDPAEKAVRIEVEFPKNSRLRINQVSFGASGFMPIRRAAIVSGRLTAEATSMVTA